MTRRSASWLLLAASAMWGSSFVASKYCINSGMLQFEIVFWRFFLGTILTALVFRKQLRRPAKSALRTGAVLGLVFCALLSVLLHSMCQVPTESS